MNDAPLVSKLVGTYTKTRTNAEGTTPQTTGLKFLVLLERIADWKACRRSGLLHLGLRLVVYFLLFLIVGMFPPLTVAAP